MAHVKSGMRGLEIVSKATLDDEVAQIAEWVVEHIGYPLDMGCGEPPPEALKRAIVTHVFVDPTGVLHGNQLSFEDAEAWVYEEAGWDE